VGRGDAVGGWAVLFGAAVKAGCDGLRYEKTGQTLSGLPGFLTYSAYV
jgi:hypothetical protein